MKENAPSSIAWVCDVARHGRGYRSDLLSCPHRPSGVAADPFGTVHIPQIVAHELDATKAPRQVRDWIARRPSWLSVDPASWANRNPRLDAGEEAAIALAGKLGASILLTDDRAGAKAALEAGLKAFGTLGILDRASKRGLIDLPDALAKLLHTNFRVRRELIETLLDGDR